MIVVGLVIGMGIFRAAATSAKDAINPSVYFVAWIIGGVVALCRSEERRVGKECRL